MAILISAQYFAESYRKKIKTTTLTLIYFNRNYNISDLIL